MKQISDFLATDRFAAQLLLMTTFWTCALLMFQFLMYTREDKWPNR
jgi:hypothetical protein